MIEKFENKLKKFINSKYVIATNSGTSALHIALLISGIKKNDEVLLPTLTFIATSNCIKYCNAYPNFIDVNDSFVIDIKKLKKYLEKIVVFKNNISYNKFTGRRISAIIAVHLFGFICNLKELQKICKKYNLKLIEDACQAFDCWDDKHAGTSGIGVLSFNCNKILEVGGGGALLLQNEDDYKRARNLIYVCKDYSKTNYYHNGIGFNYRINSYAAKIGIKKIKRYKNYKHYKMPKYQTKWNGWFYPYNNLDYNRLWYPLNRYDFLECEQDNLDNTNKIYESWSFKCGK